MRIFSKMPEDKVTKTIKQGKILRINISSSYNGEIYTWVIVEENEGTRHNIAEEYRCTYVEGDLIEFAITEHSYYQGENRKHIIKRIKGE